jgi:hypothetical protein
MESKLGNTYSVLIARIGWVALTLMLLTIFFLGIPYRYDELRLSCDTAPCPLFSLSSVEHAFLDASSFSVQEYAVFHIGLELFMALLMTAIAVLFVFKFFDNRMGILTAYFLVYLGYTFVQAPAAFVIQFPRVESFFHLFINTGSLIIFLIIFVFPNGQFVSNWLRWLFGGAGIVLISLFVVQSGVISETEPIQVGTPLSNLLAFTILMMMLIGIGSQIHRYRYVSTASEKQQTKWVLLGFVSLMLSILGWVVFVLPASAATTQSQLLLNTVGITVIYFLVYFFPISLAIAIVRHRLWDIDVIIRRTVQYSVVSVLLAGTYFGSITLIQRSITAVTGTQSPIAIVLSTLLIAALFNPLRTRVQTVVDRRFFRQKFDAQQVLAQFARTARDEVELETLRTELVNVVQKTMQPAQITVWLRDK